jgi:hypothetical protein
VWAAEVDSFTGYPHNLDDAKTSLNLEAQRRLLAAVTTANRRASAGRRHARTGRPIFAQINGIGYCNPTVLMDALESQLADSLIGQLEAYAQQAPDIDRFKVAYDESIYRGFSREETVTLARSGHLAALISINGVVIGTDKLGHFLTEGLEYYQQLSQPDAEWHDVASLGQFMESTYFGAVTTGVYSFADLAANVQGARFWIRLLNDADVSGLAPGDGPQIRCEDRQWVVHGEFDWGQYVDPAWDEAVNCSLYRNASLLKKIQAEMGDQQCPRTPLPRSLEARYGVFAKHVLNYQGMQVLPKELEPDTVTEDFLLSEHPESWWRRWVTNTLTEFYQEWEGVHSPKN